MVFSQEITDSRSLRMIMPQGVHTMYVLYFMSLCLMLVDILMLTHRYNRASDSYTRRCGRGARPRLRHQNAQAPAMERDPEVEDNREVQDAPEVAGGGEVEDNREVQD